MPGYYTDDEVKAFLPKLKVPGGDPYVKNMVKVLGGMLVKNPKMYKTFGVYWWALKEALKQGYPNKKAWFMGDYFDQLMYERAWHGSQFLTLFAAGIYHGNHMVITSGHEWTDSEGNDRDYTLFDEDAGF